MHKWAGQYSFFLFDLDGLLIDTEPLHFKAYVALAKEQGIDLVWDFSSYIDYSRSSHKGIFSALSRQYPDHFTEANWKGFYERKKEIFFSILCREKITLMPGVYELIDLLLREQKKLCVVTNSIQKYTEVIKEKIPLLSRIPHWIVREDYVNPKPFPDCYEKAVKLHGSVGDRIVGFEDTIKGYKALSQVASKPVLINEISPKEDVVAHFSSFCHLESLSSL